MAKKGRIRKQFRKRLCSYLEAQGRRADEGAPSLDVRLSFWLMEHFISIPSKRRKRAKGAWDSASFDTACRSHVPMAGVDGEGRITDQRQFPQIPFGRNGNTADHGCGWVSVYNSLLLMGRRADPSEIL